MERRDFMKSTAGSLLAGLGLAESRTAAAQSTSGSAGQTPPNILFIMVDELRYPTVFPAGVNNAAEFLEQFMPNLYALWQQGVKFANHFTAGVACTPARGTIISGLYTQQSWLVQTILSTPDSKIALQPPLNPAYPTYGKLLRKAGYQTPYIGKWHVSLTRQGTTSLDKYGFDELTFPDNTGSNLQGTVGNEDEGYHSDIYVSNQAVSWLQGLGPSQAPWCLTVSFVNPHDKEFFWAGTEFPNYNAMFTYDPNAPVAGTYAPFTYYSAIVQGQTYEPLVDPASNPLSSPKSYGYPAVPPNWETASDITKNKPSTQTYTQLFSQAVWGGVAYDSSQQGFTMAPYPLKPGVPPPKPYGVASAPYSYWQRALDSYTQTMQIVDQRIGEVLRALLQLPQSTLSNTVVVFTSDHGEYAGAHGYPSGKVGSAYNEAYHVPLIVADPTGRFNGDLADIRQGLTSSVDILTLLVSLGYNGSRRWMTPYLAALYGNRLDIIAMLKSNQAPGRPYVLNVTDEIVPGIYNFNGSPGHIVAMRTAQAKLAIYANWVGLTDQIDTQNGLETEYYDYTTPGGALEIDNTWDPTNSQAVAMQQMLLNQAIPNELRAPLPLALRIPQAISREAYLLYNQFMENYTPGQDRSISLPRLIGYGQMF